MTARRSYWREKATPIILRVLEETDGKDEREIRRALRDAYPFGPRCYWPYKVWLDEIKRQRGRRRDTIAPTRDDLRAFGQLELDLYPESR